MPSSHYYATSLPLIAHVELKNGYAQREIQEEVLQIDIDTIKAIERKNLIPDLVHGVSRLCNTRNDYFYMIISIQD